MAVGFNIELLHERALELGLGNMEIARRAHLSPKTVKAAFSGASVSRRSIARLIDVLGIDASSILRTLEAPPHAQDNGRAGAVNSSRSKGGRACRKSA